MLERGDDVFKIHDKTGVVMIPYNNSSVPLYAPNIGPEETVRMFYEALRLPANQRPEWVSGVLSQAKRKSGLLLTDRNIAPPEMVPPANALATPIDADSGKLRMAALQGYDTKTILYRGQRQPLGKDGLYSTLTPGYETQGLGVSLSNDAAKAAQYGDNVYPVVIRGKLASESDFVARINKLYETNGMSPQTAAAKVRSEMNAEGYVGLKADGVGLLDEGEVRIWQGKDKLENVLPVHQSASDIPYNAIAGGALGGAATGIAGGVAAIGGYQAYKDEQRKRNALAQ
jgi:hypothetical protein